MRDSAAAPQFLHGETIHPPLLELHRERERPAREHKLDYIHYNPVESGFVTDSIDWEYSSVRNYGNNDQTILDIDLN